MAPVTATSAGIARQIIDDPKLLSLLERLSKFAVDTKVETVDDAVRDGDDDVTMSDASGPDKTAKPPLDIDALVSELEMWPAWRFQEQADLYEWICALNAMDAALSFLMRTYPSLLLIAQSKKKSVAEGIETSIPSQAESLSDVNAVPESVTKSICTILRFLSNLLRNATNKAVFNSVEELSDLLGAADDNIASLALEALSNLACPPMLHRQQAPEMQQHSTALHTAAASCGVHSRLLALARGWGSKGSGLGLLACVTADDSSTGQGALPSHAGDLSLEYFGTTSSPVLPKPFGEGSLQPVVSHTGGASIEPLSSRLVSIQLSKEEMMKPGIAHDADVNKAGKKAEKRRRMGSPAASFGGRSIETKTTAELFFNCIQKAGGRGRVPRDKAFLLLAQLRLAKSFHSNASRVAAVERRLRALICVLHAHPSQDVISGYFQAQPELCAELVDIVRPTVSSASVPSSASLQSRKDFAIGESDQDDDGRHAIIAAVAECSVVPYSVRTLAVESLTALVARKDGANGGLTNVARQSNVLGELGVGKGQYLGLLPTLIRYSLASLNSFLSQGKGENSSGGGTGIKDGECQKKDDMSIVGDDDDEILGLGLGLAFLQATKPPALPRKELEERALEFIDSVLTLTSAVVSVPSGTAALTDCGLIPALVSTVALDSHAAQKTEEGHQISPFAPPVADEEETYSDCLLKFISAQAIQILEGAIVTHNNALSAFHDLHGVDLLVTRLHLEVEKVRKEGESVGHCDGGGSDMSVESEPAIVSGGTSELPQTGTKDVLMKKSEDDSSSPGAESKTARPLRAARRVLLFSIVNCLTVVFHQQESTSSSSSTPSGGAKLRKPELTNALIDIMDNVSSYGGVLASLIATLLSDVMNADPQVVHHVHNSGLAKSFLEMLTGKGAINDRYNVVEDMPEPNLPASAELIMAVPNVISASALTEDGAKKINDANPFPALLSVFTSSKYAMPQSRCLLNDMTAIVGTGLDEIMRHVPSLRALVMKAIVNSIRRIIFLGKRLLEDEAKEEDRKAGGYTCSNEVTELENSRTCLMQYAYNIGQILEQNLHNEEQSAPFIEEGGLDCILELYPLLMPSGRQFLSHVSCLSSPSVASLTHSTTVHSLTATVKSIASNYEPHKMMKKLIESLDKQLTQLGQSQDELRRLLASKGSVALDEGESDLDSNGILDGVPRVALQRLEKTEANHSLTKPLSQFLRNVVTTEWLTNILSTVIRAASQRSHEMGSGWGRSEREWKKEISSERFEVLLRRLSCLHRSALLEACRIRTEDGYESRDLDRRQPPGGKSQAHPAVYRIRIVCPEGAIVRDGIEIDSCANIGSLEMGEVVEAFDRCINSCGVMRYRTSRGWVSEQTRGHGREPIAEVLEISGIAKSTSVDETAMDKKMKRIECGVPDLCSASASVLARLHNSQTSLFTCLSRAIVLGVRSLPLRSLSFQQGTMGAHVGAIVRAISSNMQAGFDAVVQLDRAQRDLGGKDSTASDKDLNLSKSGFSLYLGSMLNLLHMCLYEEKRERRILNVPLLLNMLHYDGFKEGLFTQVDNVPNDASAQAKEEKQPWCMAGFFGAIRYVLKHSLCDFVEYAAKRDTGKRGQAEENRPNNQRVSRSVSACLPPSIALLRRLISRSLLIDSQMSSVLTRMKGSDLATLIGDTRENASSNIPKNKAENEEGPSFHPVRFARALHCAIADITLELWTDPRLSCAPAHIIFPVVSLIGEIFPSLEASKVSKDNAPDTSGSGRSGSGPGRSAASVDESQGDITELQQRLSRNLSAMNSFLGSGPSGQASMPGASGEGDPGGPQPPWRRNLVAEPFEPSEETISRLTEMGFSRDHALEALETTESNRVEVAMEYALAHPPPSPTTIERRRAAREQRRRRRQLEAAARVPLPPESPDANAPASTASTSDTQRTATEATESGTPNRSSQATTRNTSGTENMVVDEVDGPSNSQTEQPGDSKSQTESASKKEENILTEEEKKAWRDRDIEKKSVSVVLRCLESWKEQVTPVALSLIECGSGGVKPKDNLLSTSSTDAGRQDGGKEVGDGEAEALTVVLCTFLLSLCERYPANRSKMTCDLLLRLKSHLINGKGGNDCSVAAGKESEFAALCHATVLFMRALPRARPLVLRHGLVSCLVQCLRNALTPIEQGKGDESTKQSIWPVWLAPALLFLDVMAQPTAVPLESETDTDNLQLDNAGGGKGRRSEYARVMAEHKKQTAILSKGARHIFLALNGKHDHHAHKKKKGKEKDAKKQDGKGKEEKESQKKDQSKSGSDAVKKAEEEPTTTPDASFISANIPTYLPLIPPEMAESCMLLCLQILGVNSRRSKGNREDDAKVFIPPGVAHATLLLLTRVLRSHKLASQCLKLGGAEMILSLPSESRFAGNTGLATVFLRRMLEDETTLQTAMETEIRGTVAKLHKKQNRGSIRDSERPRVSSRAFMQSMTPLICRNPLVFLKAAATSVQIDPVSTGAGSGQKRIVLLSAEERAKNVKALDSYFRSNNSTSAQTSSSNHNSGQPNKKQSQKGNAPGSSPPHKRGRSHQKMKSPQTTRSQKSKSPHRSLSRRGVSPKKTPKKDKMEKTTSQACWKKTVTLNGTPANHITSLLLTEIINLTEDRGLKEANVDLSSHEMRKETLGKSFLWIVDHLEILADLVLVVPACAAAIHRYRPLNIKNNPKEVSGGTTLPNTAVSFLLHRLLPQVRVAVPKQNVGMDSNTSTESETASGKLDNKRQEAYMKVKVAQTTARLLVALVARAGEGRRRVVTDLAFALSGGASHSSSTEPCHENEEKEMWSLLSWGELCIGLAAPRSSSVSQDHHQSLSYEVVKLMLECGMAHALMRGVQRVKLHHPMAPTVASALLRPLEVFTRASVVDTVFTMVEKDEEERKRLAKGMDKKKSAQGLSRSSSIGPSQRSESSFADDAMLEDGFDAETAERNARQNARRRDLRQMMEGAIDMDDDDLTEELGADEEFSVESESTDDEDDDDEDGDEDDIVLEHADHSDEEEEESESDEEDSSDESSGESDIAEEESDDGMEEGESEVEDEEDEEEDEEVEAEEEQLGWGNPDDWGRADDDDFLEGNDDDINEDENEGGGVGSEMDIEEGWTRIDSTGLGGMLLGVRQRGPSAGNVHRQRAGGFIVDAAEAMIGNILRAGDIQLEALAEIEDTLGIRIMTHRVDSEQRNSRLGPLGGASNGTNSGSSARIGDSSSTNRGSVGTLPAVFQHVPPDSGYSTTSTGGRWGEINSMEYSYGGPTIGAGSHNYDLAESREQENSREFLPVPSTIDTQLFPGGPAASTHSRTQQCLHSLLSGVELPPFNALVSNLRPHGEQSAVDLSTRGTLTMGTLISSSGGNIIRLNRGPGESMMEGQPSRSSSTGSAFGLGSWTDDGQPLDSTTGEFSLAFERALGETIARNAGPDNAAASSEESTPNDANGSGTTNADGNVNRPRDNTENESTNRQDTQTISQTEPDAANDESNATSDPRQGMDSSARSAPPTQETNEDDGNNRDIPSPPTEDTSQNRTNGGSISEGEVVASSLAAGLTLSPRGESSSVSAENATQTNLARGDAEATVTADPNNEAEQHTEEADGDSGQDMDISEQSQAEPSPESSEHRTPLDAPSNAVGAGSNQEAVGSEQISNSEARGEAPSAEAPADGNQSENAPNENGLVCPSGMDLEVFNSLPFEMQQEVVEQHQATMTVATQLDSASSLDPEALAALPEEMRREVIEQEQQERRMREQTPADPANAEEMDNASFVASLAPDLREEILLAADEAFLNSLPPDIVAEAQILRERASSYHRRRHEENASTNLASGPGNSRTGGSQNDEQTNTGDSGTAGSSRKRSRIGKLKLECDRSSIIYMPACVENESGVFVTASSMKTIVRLMYLLSPVQPQRLLQKLIQNFCTNAELRRVFLSTFVALLNDDSAAAVQGVGLLEEKGTGDGLDGSAVDIDSFPPSIVIGTAPEVSDADPNSSNIGMFRRRSGGSTAAAFAANLPASARGSSTDEILPPVVAKRIISTLSFLAKNSHRICVDMLGNSGQYSSADDESGMVFDGDVTCLDRLLDLLGSPLYTKSSTNLEQLLGLLECVVNPLSNLPKDSDQEFDFFKKDADAGGGKEWVDVPRPLISHHRLQLLCKILRTESCKDSSFVKVSNIAKRLCRVEANRDCILRELAAVAQGLGVDAIRDLRSLSIRLNDAAKLHQEQLLSEKATSDSKLNGKSSGVGGPSSSQNALLSGTPSSAVTLSTSSSELRLLRVLQTLHSLCGDTMTDESTGRKSEGTVFVTPELVSLLQSINLELLWDQLTSCLRVVSVLEGVAHLDEIDDKGTGENNGANDADQDEDADGAEGSLTGGKKLQNSVAGLLTRFLPTIEAFFVVNASCTNDSGEDKKESESLGGEGNESRDVAKLGESPKDKGEDDFDIGSLVGGRRLIQFVAANKVLLNALLRSNPALLEKGLRAMVQVPRCRPFLDFDVKRQWFKTQVRRLRQHASRRHGSLRLTIRRKHVFEDAFHRLRPRTADEMRGRLHITFVNEEGVDAGGLSREFFGILAKEMFNPNYALFTSTEDGCTFQPNPNSSINPDHLSYFRFVGRIVGKAVVDGFLLDAHFTRSLYKHMLGVKPTHHDMQAIDPDYYKNLKMILEHKLDDIGVDLTFSTEDHSFGRSQTIDLIENGRNVAVTEATKEKYVSLVCQHRMTTAIQSQIKAFLEGFHELVKPDLISIFTAKELELLISGMPEIDIDDLKKNTDYQGWKATDKEIGWFWNIMFSLSRSEKAAFLQFATGSSKVPLSGFAELQGMRGTQKFSIHKAGGSSGALMSAHTCFNALDLPVYKSEEEMKEKLLYAISEGGGGFLFA